MTFSIAAWDQVSGMTGVAVLTKFFGVGSLAPFARAGVGAISTQAFVNPTFGPRGLDLLAQGLEPEDVVSILLKSDEGREHRQIHVVDRHGRTAAFTGAETISWAGHRTFPHFSVAGNMLVGEQVIPSMAEAYQANQDVDFPERMLRALEAGEAAGGDKRGRQSAAIYIVTSEVYPYLDLRVDDHANPIVEIRRIFEEAKKEYLPFKQFLPTQANPAGVYDRKLIDEIIARQAANDKTRTAS
jgi:uncharacterized Ntn-hydrolase superfamily protein